MAGSDPVTAEQDWAVEEIPDGDSLLRRVHKVHCPHEKLMPGAFRYDDGLMSVDWGRYSKPAESRARATSPPQDNGVVSLAVAKVRAIPQGVRHAPLPRNRAHTDVILDNETKVRVRMKLLQVAEWVIHVHEPVAP